jgi:hypothetical protein
VREYTRVGAINCNTVDLYTRNPVSPTTLPTSKPVKLLGLPLLQKGGCNWGLGGRALRGGPKTSSSSLLFLILHSKCSGQGCRYHHKGRCFHHPETGCRAHLSMTRRDKRCPSETSSATPQHLMKCPSSNYLAPSPPRMARHHRHIGRAFMASSKRRRLCCEDDFPEIARGACVQLLGPRAKRYEPG